MYEFSTVILSNGSADALAAELTRKSAEGWEVVSIVPTFDGRYCAFVRRTTGAPSPSAAATAAQGGYAVAATHAPSSSSGTSAHAGSGDQGQPGQPLPPADWYADPSGRFEMRYWNGEDWTEHVSRKGKQFTDPPVP